jgi:hypothetical protein
MRLVLLVLALVVAAPAFAEDAKLVKLRDEKTEPAKKPTAKPAAKPTAKKAQTAKRTTKRSPVRKAVAKSKAKAKSKPVDDEDKADTTDRPRPMP